MRAPAAVDVAPPTTGRTDLITMALGTWLMIGLFLDGYAHSNLIDGLESFFTPWHGVFYSGFLATSAWVAWIIYGNMTRGYRLRAAIPPGYAPTVVGLALFGLGGVGDGVWHTLFGIEEGVDALLSPTHFLLFVGGILGLSTVVRTTRVRAPGSEMAASDRLPLLLSLLLVTAGLAFFTVYMWIPGQASVLTIPFAEAEGAVGFYIGGALVSTIVLLSPQLIVLRWWRPPRGTFLLTWALVNAALALSFNLDLGVSVVFGLTGGLTGELLVRLTDPGPARRTASLLTVALTPVVAWSALLVAVELATGIAWPPEIWSGSVIISGLAGAGIGWIALPDAERGPAPLIP